MRSENLTGKPLSLILLGLATPVRRYNPVHSKPNHHSLPLPLDCVLVFWVGGACLWRGLVRAARGYLRVNSRGKAGGSLKKKAGQVTPQAARPPRLFSTSFMPRRRRLDRAGRCRTCVAWCVDGVPSRCASRCSHCLAELSVGPGLAVHEGGPEARCDRRIRMWPRYPQIVGRASPFRRKPLTARRPRP